MRPLSQVARKLFPRPTAPSYATTVPAAETTAIRFHSWPVGKHQNRRNHWKKRRAWSVVVVLLLVFVTLALLFVHLHWFIVRSRRASDRTASDRRSAMRILTENFVIECNNLEATTSSAGSQTSFLGVRWVTPTPVVSQLQPTLFSLVVYHQSSVKVIWQSIPGLPFLKAAAGNDSLTPGNGEYRIQQDNHYITTHQTIHSVTYHPRNKLGTDKPRTFQEPWRAQRVDYAVDDFESFEHVVITGQLLLLPERSATPYAMLLYRLTLYEKTNQELGFHVQVVEAPPPTLSIDPSMEELKSLYDRVLITQTINQGEEIFGLGEQFSVWSMKGYRVPIITREQGIGRGLQPITYILNHVPPRNPSYSGGDTFTTYTAIGHYITSHGRSLLLRNSELSFFDFQQANRSTIEVISRSVSLTLFHSDRPFDLLRQYTEQYSGRMRRMPDWAAGANGAIVGIQGGQERVWRVIKQLRAWNVPIAAVWLQDWVGLRSQSLDLAVPIPFPFPGLPSRTGATVQIQMTAVQKRLWWNWEYDREAYPDWPDFVRRLRVEMGIRVMTYINPFLTDVESAGKPKESWTRNYFREASEKGYLVKRWVQEQEQERATSPLKEIPPQEAGQWKLVDYLVSSGPSVSAGMIDLSNPHAFSWYKKLIKENMLEHGVSGWMADFGEYLPFDSVSYAMQNDSGPPPTHQHSGTTVTEFARSFHNLYPQEWARLNREAVEEMQQEGMAKDVVFFSRSGSVMSPKFAHCFWTGDQMHTWDHLDGLESTIFASLSASISGMAYIHSDIGGYTTLNTDPNVTIKFGNRSTSFNLPVIERRARFVRDDKELFLRWMEVAAFSSTGMFRTHEGSVPVENLQPWSDEGIARQFAYFAGVFQALLPYRKLLTQEYERHGYPILRPIFLHYPHGNAAAVKMERLEFMLGPLMLVVPVTTKGLEYLNAKIVDSPEEENGKESEVDEFFESVLERELLAQTDRKSPDGMQTPEPLSVSHDSIDSDTFSEEDAPKLVGTVRNGRFGKGKVLASLKSWVQTVMAQTVRFLLDVTQPSPTKHDVEPGERQQSDNDAHTQPRSVPGRWKEGKLRQLLFTKTNGLTSSSHYDPSATSKPSNVPNELPPPHHGRPYLPPGTWVHIWTGTRFEVKDPRGMYLSDKDELARLPCPIGQPGVFLRDMTEQEMSLVLEKGRRPDLDTSMGGEDAKYWSDALGSKESGDAAVGWEKYRLLRHELDKFLAWIGDNPYPHP